MSAIRRMDEAHLGGVLLRTRRVFECGIGTTRDGFPGNMGADGKPGASLRVWRDYFPNAHVYGADIDSEVLFAEERIETFQVDQTSAASISAVRTPRWTP